MPLAPPSANGSSAPGDVKRSSSFTPLANAGAGDHALRPSSARTSAEAASTSHHHHGRASPAPANRTSHGHGGHADHGHGGHTDHHGHGGGHADHHGHGGHTDHHGHGSHADKGRGSHADHHGHGHAKKGHAHGHGARHPKHEDAPSISEEMLEEVRLKNEEIQGEKEALLAEEATLESELERFKTLMAETLQKHQELEAQQAEAFMKLCQETEQTSHQVMAAEEVAEKEADAAEAQAADLKNETQAAEGVARKSEHDLKKYLGEIAKEKSGQHAAPAKEHGHGRGHGHGHVHLEPDIPEAHQRAIEQEARADAAVEKAAAAEQEVATLEERWSHLSHRAPQANRRFSLMGKTQDKRRSSVYTAIASLGHKMKGLVNPFAARGEDASK